MGKFVCINGQMLPVHQASLGVTDRGFLLGDGLFETIRVKDGKALWFSAHLSRLMAGAEILGFPPINDDFESQVASLVEANKVINGVVRITVSRGEGQRGINLPESPIPTTLVSASPSFPSRQPLSLHVVSSLRRNQFSPLFRIKSLNYLDNIMARKEATDFGADDAILLNTVGKVTETSIGNLLFLLNDQWVTPPVNDGVLPGTARARLLASGLTNEMSLDAGDLEAVESAIMVNALSLRAVTRIDANDLKSPSDSILKSMESCLNF